MEKWRPDGFSPYNGKGDIFFFIAAATLVIYSARRIYIIRFNAENNTVSCNILHARMNTLFVATEAS